jgi:hypothetical protein
MDLARSEVQEEAVQVEGAANAQSPRQEYVWLWGAARVLGLSEPRGETVLEDKVEEFEGKSSHRGTSAFTIQVLSRELLCLTFFMIINVQYNSVLLVCSSMNSNSFTQFCSYYHRQDIQSVITPEKILPCTCPLLT